MAPEPDRAVVLVPPSTETINRTESWRETRYGKGLIRCTCSVVLAILLDEIVTCWVCHREWNHLGEPVVSEHPLTSPKHFYPNRGEWL